MSNEKKSIQRQRFEEAARAIKWPDTAFQRDEHGTYEKAYTETSWILWQACAISVASFQQRVQPWMMECFGPMIAGDREERNHRFLEEALELVQSTGCTASEAHQLVDYVYGRPVGEPAQEVGGVMVTLAALCLANALDMHQCGETELARIWTNVEAIRAKQAAKPKHSPLPVAARAQAIAGELPPPASEEWSYSTNEEDYREQEASRLGILSHALNELGDDYDGEFWIGRNVRFSGSGKAMVEIVIEGLQEQAYEECGEYAETYLDDVTNEEEKQLGDFITAWAARVDRSNFWTVTAVEKHTAESARATIAAILALNKTEG